MKEKLQIIVENKYNKIMENMWILWSNVAPIFIASRYISALFFTSGIYQYSFESN